MVTKHIAHLITQAKQTKCHGADGERFDPVS